MNSTVFETRNFEHELFIPIGLCNRTYRLIQLSNGILTLLISDPTEDTSAVSLSVCSGAYNDPDEISGLAHFCEHMILLGSKKYPKPNHLQKLVGSTNEGMLNAYTTGEITCFYFQMKSPNNDFRLLDESLKVFSDTFCSPTFNMPFMKKEMMAIDNEHLRNKTNLTKILFHGLRLLSEASPGNVFRRFATGNLSTLLKVPTSTLRDSLITYFDSNYKPRKFALVVKSPQSVNLIQKLVLSSFGSIPQYNFVEEKEDISDFQNIRESYDHKTKPFNRKQLNRCIFIKFVIKANTENITRLAFPLDYNADDADQSKKSLLFADIMVRILGDESSGSTFYQFLQRKNYIQSMECFISELKIGSNCLIVQLKLTKTGSRNIDHIISMFFRTINETFKLFFEEKELKKSEIIDSLASYLSDALSIDLLNYLYLDVNQTSMDEVSDYSVNLQQSLRMLGPKWILRGMPSWNDFEGFKGFHSENDDAKKWWEERALEFYKFVVGNINYNNFNLLVYGKGDLIKTFNELFLIDDDYYNEYSKQFAIQGSDFYEDPHFCFSYKYFKINVNYLKGIDGISVKSEIDSMRIIFNKNIFIPEFARKYDLVLRRFEESFKISSKNSLGFSNNKNSIFEGPPILLESDRHHQIYYKPEHLLKYSGKMIVSIDIVSTGIAKASAKQIVSNEILCEIISARLYSKLHSSEPLGYSWNLTTSSKNDLRIGIIVGGFSARIDLLITLILNELLLYKRNRFASVIDDALYFKSRSKIKEFYENLAKQNSFQLATAGSVVLLEENSIQLERRLEELSDNTYEDIEELVHQIFHNENNSLYTNIFVQGDVGKEQAFRISSQVDILTNHLFRGHIPKEELNYKCPNTHFIKQGHNYYFERSSPDFTNSIVYFIQTGLRDDSKNRTLTKLLSFFVSLDAITELRSNKQLGYVVTAGLRIYRNTTGIHISIVSGNYEPEALENEINKYLMSLEHKLRDMTQKDFDEQIKFPFLRMYINDESGILPESNSPKNFFGKINEGNIGSYLNSSMKATDSANFDLEDLSRVSMVKSGSSLSNLNTGLADKHFQLWEEIISKTYRFQSIRTNYLSNSNDSYGIDLLLINRLEKYQFMEFWDEKVSIRSPRISKLSIWIKKDGEANRKESSENNEERQIELMVSQIEILLMFNNLLIPREKLIEIVRESKGNETLMMKSLLKYFMKNGERMKVLVAILKNVFKGVNVNLKGRFNGKRNSSAGEIDKSETYIKLSKIEEISEFHRNNPPI
ncbi:Axl1 protein [Saccharomycopsis crataegensis]|uniref:Axl1 protein n=1 Tax=Saccharomycopsis crataegensis TaxID=43959 RepID=A0AAV5QGQ8_9ASCO|nr:Axl1 protein [Saccharomycopsis crataegensis]